MESNLFERLQQAAHRRGYTSDRSRSGIDVSAMAAAIGSSYEMARRYAEGAAMPKPETVRALALWLQVSPTWLMYGDGDMESPGDIDIAALETCLRVVEDAQRIAGVSLPVNKLAPLVAGLYQQAVAGEKPSVQSVAHTLRALAR